MGFDVDLDRHHFDDNDMSAFSGKTRPNFEKMLEGMKRGEFTAIVCWHPDRLYRSLKDLERLIDMADAADAQICSVNGGDFDLSTATGKMVARILGSVSRQESEHKGERQRRANDQRRTEGKWLAMRQVPFGYRRVGTKKNYTIVPVEPAASMIRKAASDVLAGVSIHSICVDWNRRGIKTSRGTEWNNLKLVDVLINPIFAALVHTGRSRMDRRVIGTGDWEPILDLDTHLGLVAFLTDPARKKPALFVRLHQGSMIYECGICGAKLKAQRSVNGIRKYQCPTFHLARIAEPIDELVTATVLRILGATNIRSRLVDAPDVNVDELRTTVPR